MSLSFLHERVFHDWDGQGAPFGTSLCGTFYVHDLLTVFCSSFLSGLLGLLPTHQLTFLKFFFESFFSTLCLSSNLICFFFEAAHPAWIKGNPTFIPFFFCFCLFLSLDGKILFLRNNWIFFLHGPEPSRHAYRSPSPSSRAWGIRFLTQSSLGFSSFFFVCVFPFFEKNRYTLIDGRVFENFGLEPLDV